MVDVSIPGEEIPATTTRNTKLTTQRFLKKETADYSAITPHGVYSILVRMRGANLILLDAIKGRYEFPELRKTSGP